MKKVVAAVVAALVLAAGAALGVRQATSDSTPCQKPLTLLGSEQTESITVLERYISDVIAPTVKSPQYLQWASDDYSPILLPNRISARIALIGGGSVLHYYHVTLVRDCQGGDWKVIEFKLLKT